MGDCTWSGNAEEGGGGCGRLCCGDLSCGVLLHKGGFPLRLASPYAPCVAARARPPTPLRSPTDRNGIKALPWHTTVRTLLEDRSQWGLFMPLAGCMPTPGEYVCGDTATTNLYHVRALGWQWPPLRERVCPVPCCAHRRM